MAAGNAAAPDPILLSAWDRDYRHSLLVVVTGFILLVADGAFGLWAFSTGGFPTSGVAGLSLGLTGTAGFMLVILGASWAYTNRRLLQLNQRGAGRT